MNTLIKNIKRAKKNKDEDRFFDDLSKIDSNKFDIKGPNNNGWYGIFPSDGSAGKKAKVWSTIDILDDDGEYCIIDFHDRKCNASVHSTTGKIAMHKTIRRTVPGADFSAVVRDHHPTFRFKTAYYKEVVEAMFKNMY